jgi:hypothetical protein
MSLKTKRVLVREISSEGISPSHIAQKMQSLRIYLRE